MKYLTKLSAIVEAFLPLLQIDPFRLIISIYNQRKIIDLLVQKITQKKLYCVLVGKND